jgi:hypothetical protein
MWKYPNAQDVEHEFLDRYKGNLERLAVIEGIALPSCNDGNTFLSLNRLQRNNLYISLGTDFLRSLLICIKIMPEIKKIRHSCVETKTEKLVVFLPVINL